MYRFCVDYRLPEGLGFGVVHLTARNADHAIDLAVEIVGCTPADIQGTEEGERA